MFQNLTYRNTPVFVVVIGVWSQVEQSRSYQGFREITKCSHVNISKATHESGSYGSWAASIDNMRKLYEDAAAGAYMEAFTAYMVAQRKAVTDPLMPIPPAVSPIPRTEIHSANATREVSDADGNKSTENYVSSWVVTLGCPWENQDAVVAYQNRLNSLAQSVWTDPVRLTEARRLGELAEISFRYANVAPKPCRPCDTFNSEKLLHIPKNGELIFR